MLHWCKIFFSAERIEKVLQTKEQNAKILYIIDTNLVNVVCDSCLNVYHMACTGLKKIPKTKLCFCKDCK